MTKTDTDFTAQFSPETVAGMISKETTLGNWTPTANTINVGMLSDIGKAIINGAPVFQNSFYGKYLRAPLQRGDSFMMGRFGEVQSSTYNPAARDTELFDVQDPTFTAYVAKKNFSRQIRTNVADRWLRQFCQTQEMIGDAHSAIMQASTARYYDDVFTAAKAYVSGSTRGSQTEAMPIMTNDLDTAAGQAELIEKLWTFSQNKLRYKSTKYNPAQYNTFSKSVHIALKKDCQYAMYKKLADTFHEDLLQAPTDISWVDDFATPAGKPSGAGELIGIISDSEAFHFVPMPEGVVTESFRNPASLSTYYYTTYETAFGQDLTQNIVYLFAPQ